MSSQLIAAKNSVLGSALIGKNSLLSRRGFLATTPVFMDYNQFIFQTNGVTTPTLSTIVGGSSEVVFAMPKASTLISNVILQCVLGAGTVNPLAAPGTVVEYIKNFGDLLARDVVLQYGNTQLQRYDADFVVFNRRLCHNDVNIEGINISVFGNLPPSTNPSGTEATLRDAYLQGCTVLAPLEELYFVHAKDEAWMPESLALEGQIRIQLASLPELLISTNGTIADVGTAPTIQDCRLRYHEFTLSAAEKENRLKLYKTPEGAVTHFLDLERQLGHTFRGLQVGRAAGSALSAQPLVFVPPIQLSNIRMDMAEIIFTVRRLSNDNTINLPDERGVIGTPMQGSRYESNSSNSLVTGAPINTMIQISSFALNANGKEIFASNTDLMNRAYIRKYYHPDSQAVDPVYTIPLAFFPEDRRNATGHLSASVLGNMTLDIVLPDPGATIVYQIDIWVHSHNIIQSRGGGITKALF